MTSPSKIALIGGSGFIGTRLTADLIALGHDVRIGDLRESGSFNDRRSFTDVRDEALLLEFVRNSGADTIINLAAAHRDDVRPVSLYYDTNVSGARVTCDVASKLGIKRIIFTSSVAVYGHQDGEPDESAPHHPINPYGETKSQAEDVFRAWAAEDPANRTLIIIRPTVVFGPTNRGNVHALMDQIARGRFLMVGNGANRKSMAYVGNISGFIAHTLSLGSGSHVFNYIDKPDFTTAQLVALIFERTEKGVLPAFRLPKWVGLLAGGVFDILARVSGRTFPISRIRVEKFCAQTVFNADKVKASGYVPPVSLRDALIETIDAEFNGTGSPRPE